MKHLLSAAGATVIGFSVALLASQAGVRWNGLTLLVWLVLAVFVIQWIVFAHSLLARTEKYFDLTASLTYVGVTLFGLAISGAPSLTSWILAAVVTIWALRLGLFLFRRTSRAGGDTRFEKILQSPPRLFSVWTLQALWISLTAMPAWLGMVAADHEISWISLVGLVLWMVGFAVEVTADHQKSAFRADPGNGDDFIRTGLWAWSRHPNYFGEIVLWTGVFLIAAPSLQGWQWLAVLSPVFVVLLLTRVSGIPMLEAKADARWGGRADYEVYKRSTSVLLPVPPRR